MQDRFSRQMLLPEFDEVGQAKIRNSQVLVVGVGGLGGPVSIYLAAAGVGRLSLVDSDTVEASNLNRQILFDEADVGQSKVRRTAQRLRAFSSHTEVFEYPTRLDETNALEWVSRHTLIVDCTDSLRCKYLLGDAAAHCQVPLVSAAISRFDGILGVYSSRGGGCFRCAFPNFSDPWKVSNCSQNGVLGSFVGVMATLQANEAIKVILEIETLRNEVFCLNGQSLELLRIAFARNPECEACGRLAFAVSPGAWPAHWPLDLPGRPSAAADHANAVSYDEICEWKRAGLEVVLVDVREAHEHVAGHLPGSVNLPLGTIGLGNKVALSSLLPREPNQRIVFYCQSGVRSENCLGMIDFPEKSRCLQLKGGLDGLQKSDTLCSYP